MAFRSSVIFSVQTRHNNNPRSSSKPTSTPTFPPCTPRLRWHCNTGTSLSAELVPFIVERLQGTPSCKSIYREIASMCIEAFFNDDSSSSTGATTAQEGLSSPPLFLPFSSSGAAPFATAPITKSLQLAYLRTLQSGDLQRRRERDGAANVMFVARRLVPLRPGDDPSDTHLTTPLVVEFSNAHNCRQLLRGATNGDLPDVVRGEILGFVEVTNRPFGLGLVSGGCAGATPRPVLTNLSVSRDARRAGVGSRLLDACERYVASEWGQSEVVLEVEDDNELAKNFYRKRGYEIVYTDHTARRYDLSGLWLREVRCRRLVMRKQLQKPEAVQSSVSFGIKVLQVLRDNMFAAVA